MKKFELGRVVATKSVSDLMKDDVIFDDFVKLSLKKYTNCDWGDTCKEDCIQNDEAIKNGERIVAKYTNEEYIVGKYTSKKYTIWIITEWDRSVTTVLFPEEY